MLASLTLSRGFELARSTAVAARRWRGNTWRTYFYSVRIWEAHGFATFNDLTRERVAAFKARRLTKDLVEPGSVNSDLAALLSVVTELEAYGANPGRAEELVKILRGARIPVKKRQKRRATFLTREEVDRLCAAAREVEPRSELPLLVAVWSGLRVSELARMRREDFKAGPKGWILHVDEVPELGDDGFAKTGPRNLPVCAQLRELVETRAPASGFVFPPGGTKNPRGVKTHRAYLSVDVLERDIRRIRMVAKMQHVTWNTLRHTRASWWAQAGVPRMKIAEWLGNSEDVCEEFYVGLVTDYDPDVEKCPGDAAAKPPSSTIALLPDHAARLEAAQRALDRAKRSGRYVSPPEGVIAP